MKAHENSEQSIATAALMQAMLNPTTKLGIQGIFRRLAPSELPDTLWGSNIEVVEETTGLLLIRARHLCPPSCSLIPRHCFTALKLEDIICKRKSQPYAVSSVDRVGDDVEVRLQLFS